MPRHSAVAFWAPASRILGVLHKLTGVVAGAQRNAKSRSSRARATRRQGPTCAKSILPAIHHLRTASQHQHRVFTSPSRYL